MNAKHPRLLWLILPLAYVALFFIWAPAHMAATRYGAHFLVPAIDGYNRIAYHWWFSALSEDNWIVRIGTQYNAWWCHQFTTCTVQ